MEGFLTAELERVCVGYPENMSESEARYYVRDAKNKYGADNLVGMTLMYDGADVLIRVNLRKSPVYRLKRLNGYREEELQAMLKGDV